jgi:hypothetical protein
MLTKRLPQVILGLLILQFVLGMLANLYQELPDTDREVVLKQFGYISVHGLVALMLLVFGGWLVYLTKRSGRSMRLPVAGLGAMLVAFVCGLAFVSTGNDLWSLLMAITFLGAFINYLRLVFGGDAKVA